MLTGKNESEDIRDLCQYACNVDLNMPVSGLLEQKNLNLWPLIYFWKKYMKVNDVHKAQKCRKKCTKLSTEIKFNNEIQRHHICPF